MKRSVWMLRLFTLIFGASLLRGQFFGLVVFDPSVFAKVAAQLIEMGNQLGACRK